MIRLFTTLFTIALLFTLVSCGGDTNSESKTDAAAQAGEQQTETATTATTAAAGALSFEAYDTDGSLRKASEWVGKQPVVINFWGTWCPPCRHEIPDLVEVYDEYRHKGIEMLGIAFNNRDNAQTVNRYAKQQGMEWVLLLGDIQLAKDFEISSVPTTMFIGKDGKPHKVWDPMTNDSTWRISGIRDKETFKKMFESML